LEDSSNPLLPLFLPVGVRVMKVFPSSSSGIVGKRRV